MAYIVVELQTNANGVVGILSSAYEDRNSAENKYHTVLAYAAISELPAHAAVMLTNDGRLLGSDVYYHAVPEPEPDEEPEQEVEENE